MATAGRLPLEADRHAPFFREIQFTGENLTGAMLHAQVRLTPDTPGEPVVDLPLVTEPDVTGLRFIGVDPSGVLPISTVHLLVTEADMANRMPAAAEIGEDVTLAWDMQVTPVDWIKEVWLAGPFIIKAGVTR